MVPGYLGLVPWYLSLVPGYVGLVPGSLGLVPGSLGLIPRSLGLVPWSLGLVPRFSTRYHKWLGWLVVVGESKVQDGFQEKANCPPPHPPFLTYPLTMPQAAGKNRESSEKVQTFEPEACVCIIDVIFNAY